MPKTADVKSLTGADDGRRESLLGPEWADHLTFKVPEAARILKVSRWLGYEEVKRGNWPVIEVGNALRIPRHFIERKLSGERKVAGQQTEAIK
jgi:hypothetical protein